MARTIICNKCGKTMDDFDLQQEFYYHKELCYGSEHDGDTVEIDLCCDCIDDLINSCKVSPVIRSRFNYEEM